MLEHSRTANFFSYVDGVRVAFRAYNYDVVRNDGLPLTIFLHEGLGSIKNWRNFPETVADIINAPVLLYERRGYGLTGGDFPTTECESKFGEGFGAWTYLHNEAVFLKSFIELFTPREVILVGHSDGASISLLYAAAFPERVKAVAAIAPHTFLEDAALKGIIKARGAFAAGKLRSRLEAQHGDKAEDVFNFWADNWSGESFINFDFRPALGSIESPVLAIQGDRDEYATLAQIDSICERVKNCKKIILPDCGHIPHITHSKDLASLLVDFIGNIL